jgi:hypothetical protein
MEDMLEEFELEWHYEGRKQTSTGRYEKLQKLLVQSPSVQGMYEEW